MRKEFPITINSDEEWIDLPQGTHIHPKEVEKMFDDKEMGENGREGREYGALIRPRGDIDEEVYGGSNYVQFVKPRTYGYAKDAIMTHSHPKALIKQELDEGIISIPPLSDRDFSQQYREIRAFSQETNDPSIGQIHSFKHNDYGDKRDVKKRKKFGDNYIDEQKEIVNKNCERLKFQQAMKTIKGFPMSNNMYTASEFNLAHRGKGDTSIIHVRKSEDPKKVYITGIRSTYKNEPQYDLLQTLPRKKKLVKPLLSRKSPVALNGFGLVKLNLTGLSTMLIGMKKNL